MSNASGWEGAEKIGIMFKLLNGKIRAEILQVYTLGMLQIAMRMKQIITDNGHVVTGNLRRSCTGGAELKLGWWHIEGWVKAGDTASGVHYAPAVEALPDGGFFYRAIEEMKPIVEAGVIAKIKRILDQ